MKEKNQLESFIRSKLQEKSFPYQEAYWKDAQAQFAVWDRRKRRRRGFLWLILGLCLCALGGWAGHLWIDDTSREAMAQVNPTQEFPMNQACMSDSSSVSDHNSYSESQLPTSSFSTLPKSTVNTSSVSDHLPTASRRANVNDHIGSKEQSAPILDNSQPLLTSTINTQRIINALSRNRGLRLSLKKILPQGIFLLPYGANSTFNTVKMLPPSSRKIRPYLQFSLARSSSIDPLGNSAWDWMPEVEGGIAIPWNRTMNLTVGIGYFSKVLSGTSAELGYRTYDFIFREQLKLWQPEELHYAGLSLSLSKQILTRHEIGIGGKLAYLLTTSGLLTEGQNTSFSETSGTPEPVWHYRNGLPDWDIQGRIFYQYQLHRRLSAKIEGSMGLRDLTKDPVFHSTAPIRNSRMVFSLIYWLR